MYRVDNKSNGPVERYKASLVTKGYKSRRRWLSWKIIKTFTVRVLFAIAAAKFLEQLDINNIFLHSDLDGEVYMVVLPGFSAENSSKVCRLVKPM